MRLDPFLERRNGESGLQPKRAPRSSSSVSASERGMAGRALPP